MAAMAIGLVSIGLAGCGDAPSVATDGFQIKLPPVPTRPDRGLPMGVAFATPKLGFVASVTGQPTAGPSGSLMAALGIVSRTTNSGRAWRTVWQQHGVTLGWLGISGNLVIATGVEYPTSGRGGEFVTPVLLLGDTSGQSWRLVHPKLPGPPTADSGWGTAAVQWVSPSLAVASTAPWEVGSIAQPLVISRDGGIRWTAVDLPGGSSTGGVSVVSATDMFATGTPANPSPNCQGAIWETTDQGLDWAMLPGSCSVAPLYAVQFLNQQIGFAGGGNMPEFGQPPGMLLLETTDAGTTWSLKSEERSPGDLSLPLVQIEFTTPELGAVSTGGCGPGANGPCSGQVYTTDDGGNVFQPTTADGMDLVTAGGRHLWVLDGRADVVLASSNGGGHWTTLPGVSQLYVAGLSFQSGSLMVFTPLGAFASADGGRTWKMVSSPTQPGSVGYAPPRVEVLDSLSVLVSSVGSSSVETKTKLSNGGEAGLSSIAFASSERGIVVGSGNQCLKPGIPAESAPVFITDDAGRKWRQVSELPFGMSQVAYSGGFVVALGEDGCHMRLATSADSGTTWTTRSLPGGAANCLDPSVTDAGDFWLTCSTVGVNGATYLDAGSIVSGRSITHKAAGLSLQAMFAFSARGELYAVGTDRGTNILWKSRNDGQTWQGEVLILPDD